MKLISLVVIVCLLTVTTVCAAPSGGGAPGGTPSGAPGPAPAPIPGAAPGTGVGSPAPAGAPGTGVGAPAPAGAPGTGVGAPAPAVAGPPGTAPIKGPSGAPGVVKGTAANTNPNIGIGFAAQQSVANALAPAKTGNPAPTSFPAGSPGASKKASGLGSCKFCCVNAQKGTWTPGPGKKSGCADKSGAGARYRGCCDRLGDCCPVAIGLPSSLYQCCDSSQKEVCAGTIYQPKCTIDFTIPDPAAKVKSKATPAPAGAPGAPASSPAGAPALSPGLTFTSVCDGNAPELATGRKLPGTCFRRCDIRGNGCGRTPSYQQPYYQQQQLYYQPSYYSGLRQYNFGAIQNFQYGLSYGMNQLLPNPVPSFQQFAPATTQTTGNACDQASCSCDSDCETRGDCCFDYCSFCVVV